jgi:hypothetical protein
VGHDEEVTLRLIEPGKPTAVGGEDEDGEINRRLLKRSATQPGGRQSGHQCLIAGVSTGRTRLISAGCATAACVSRFVGVFEVRVADLLP